MYPEKKQEQQSVPPKGTSPREIIDIEKGPTPTKDRNRPMIAVTRREPESTLPSVPPKRERPMLPVKDKGEILSRKPEPIQPQRTSIMPSTPTSQRDRPMLPVKNPPLERPKEPMREGPLAPPTGEPIATSPPKGIYREGYGPHSKDDPVGRRPMLSIHSRNKTYEG